MREIIIRGEEETRAFGRQLAEELKPGDVLALIGDLGTGKTTLTKFIAEGLGIEESVTSPTFTIVNEYRSGRLPLFHFDAYRLEGVDPFETGIEEYFYDDDKGGSGVCVVEWADLIIEILPEDAKYIFLEYGDNEGERLYKCTF